MSELNKLAEDTFTQMLKNPIKQQGEHIEAQRRGFIKGYQKAQENTKEILIDFIEWYAENNTADFGSNEGLAEWFLTIDKKIQK